MRELWILIPITAISAVAWVIYIVVDGFRRRQQARMAAEFHSKLLDRIGSAREFGEFLNTTGGTKFLDSLTIEREGGPHTRILRALQAGLMLLAVGIGLFLYAASRNLPIEGEDVVTFLATLTTALGTGLLLAAAASYTLSKRMGLFSGQDDRRDASPAQPA
jgi:hypothetical protein